MLVCDANRYTLGPRIEGDRHAVLRFAISVATAGPDVGWGVEFGVAKGHSLALIARRMPAVGFDSFEGLPEDWRPGFPRGRFACRQPHVKGAEIVAGRFADTLPRFNWAAHRPGLVHIDCDLHSSTATALRYIGPHLRPGCVLVFDEWHGYPGCEIHEQLAWRNAAVTPSLRWRVLGHGVQQWAIQLTER